MKFRGRLPTGVLLWLAATGFYAQAVYAQAYPSKSIRFMVPYSTGSATDALIDDMAKEVDVAIAALGG